MQPNLPARSAAKAELLANRQPVLILPFPSGAIFLGAGGTDATAGPASVVCVAIHIVVIVSVSITLSAPVSVSISAPISAPISTSAAAAAAAAFAAALGHFQAPVFLKILLAYKHPT